MRSSKYKPSRMLILLTAMAVLLPLLAALQYRWLGQVSEGATERLQSSLRARAKEFRYDFNREFIRAYLNFHVDSFAPPDDIEGFHLERFERWTQTATYPHLISDVFVVKYDEQGLPHLSHLDQKSRRLESKEWTGENAVMRARFERSKSSPTNAGQSSFDSFAEDIPALMVPFPLDANEKSQRPRTPPLPPGFTIVKLDLGYMQREFIPSLVKRHLFDGAHTEYNVAVVSFDHPDQVIYSSGSPAVDSASSDVSTRIFGLEPDELRTFAINEAAASDQTGPRRLINLRLLKRSSPDASAASSADDGRWQLLIKHQAGSLAAAVRSARRRNLAISFGILLLLGVGIFMTAISTRRAQRLAQQQINFVAGVTHELRTPLAVICSAGENMAHGIVDSPGKVAQYGDVISREGRRLTDMVEQVLEFAGAQSGRQRYDFRPVDVAEVINRAVASCQIQIKEREFTIETQLDPDLPVVQGDAAALGRVVQNLISNAVKYDGRNRWARVSAQTSTDEDGNEVRISVEDRGLGIDPKDVPHIFEPFYRGHEALAAQIEGSGLGLSLVKQIVEAHGGSISVKSAPGIGSTFTISLPKTI